MARGTATAKGSRLRTDWERPIREVLLAPWVTQSAAPGDGSLASALG
jgi:hypothetical protein